MITIMMIIIIPPTTTITITIRATWCASFRHGAGTLSRGYYDIIIIIINNEHIQYISNDKQNILLGISWYISFFGAWTLCDPG